MTKSDLHLLFAPRSIAVAGASNKTGKMGNLFMQRLTADFRGTLYAINPTEREVGGVTTVKSIAEVLHPIDLLIALVPAARLIELVEPCRPGQVRYLLAIPSGFAEISPQGRALQERLASAARSRGIRTLGPNVVGVMNAIAGINASMMPALPPGGRGLSCITQSGGFGMALSMYALDHVQFGDANHARLSGSGCDYHFGPG
jgi:acyl-CoA synthetase (NDP forming)